ncbi:MAG TPA: hypothetical protein PKI66_05335, partial [Methanobacteriaceae archaeon]|nr:hypothetical protein [Methanobacteriaceae archaeon]
KKLDKELYVKEAIQNRVDFVEPLKKTGYNMGELHALKWVLKLLNDEILVYDEETYWKLMKSEKDCPTCNAILLRVTGKYNGTYESYAPPNEYGRSLKEHLTSVKEADGCMGDTCIEKDGEKIVMIYSENK